MEKCLNLYKSFVKQGQLHNLDLLPRSLPYDTTYRYLIESKLLEKFDSIGGFSTADYVRRTKAKQHEDALLRASHLKAKEAKAYVEQYDNALDFYANPLLDIYGPEIDKFLTDSLNKVASSDFENVLFSPLYKDSVKIPKFFQERLDNMLDTAIKSLVTGVYRDSSYYDLVKGCKIVLYNPNQGVLWFSNNMKKKEIYISPLIIRAIYIRVFNQFYKEFNSYVSARNSWGRIFSGFDPHGLNMGNPEFVNELFNSFFLTELAFLLHHEMAHIYLGTGNTPETNESKCDCYALAFFSHREAKLQDSNDLGSYKRLLMAAISHNRPDLWDVDAADTNLLKARFRIVESLVSRNITYKTCDSIYSQPKNSRISAYRQTAPARRSN